MTWARWATVLAALCLTAIPVAAWAADSTLTLVIGGEAYDGPPKFAVTFDGQPVGEGAVAAAIDTAAIGRFADAVDKTQYVQSFEFRIPEAMFRPAGEVHVRLINEAFGGEGSNRDRNLYLASVSVNGRAVTASGFTTVSAKGLEPNATLGEFLVLYDGNGEAVTAAPQGGWPAPPRTDAEAGPQTPAPPAATDPVVTGSVSTAPARPAPAVPKLDAAIEPLRTASLDPDPEGNGRTCDIDRLYNVVGFNENSNALTPKLTARLDQIAHDIGTRRCTVLLTGYSSKQGAFATSALFAVERAQQALKYLRDQGVRFIEASATGVGATDRFGPDPRANRRVVITVRP